MVEKFFVHGIANGARMIQRAWQSVKPLFLQSSVCVPVRRQVRVVGCRPPGGNVGDTYRHADWVAGTAKQRLSVPFLMYRVLSHLLHFNIMPPTKKSTERTHDNK